MKKRLLLLACFLLFGWSMARFCHHQTHGFRLSKLHGNTTPFPTQGSPTATLAQETLLAQRFTYLGRGLQSFSFLGEDGTTVLKVFNNKYQTRLRFLAKVPSVGPLKTWREEQIACQTQKLRKTFESYALAAQLLENEAGILYFHPQTSETPFDTPLSIVDPLGIVHTLDPNQIGFVLQKKAELVYPYLLACEREGDLKKGQQAIDRLLALLSLKMEKGMADSDPLIRTNFGFVHDHPIQIDIGPLSKDASLQQPQRQKEELVKITRSLKHWLEAHYPALAPYVDETIDTR